MADELLEPDDASKRDAATDSSSTGLPPAACGEAEVGTSSSDGNLRGDEEVGNRKRVRFAALQREVKESGLSPISFLPVLGQEGYVRERRSHLFAAYPKGGKTTLFVQLIQEWADWEILFLSEEGEETWADRAYELPEGIPDNCELVFCLGMSREEIWDIYCESTADVVIADSVRATIRPEDEDKAPIVSEALAPWVSKAREKRQTLILVHHDNKHGGKGGKGISGSHAYLGVVDIFLELDEVRDQENRRLLSGRGRIRNIDPLLYERSEDGSLKACASGDLAGSLRMLGKVSDGWKTTSDLAAEAGVSPSTAERHLKSLGERGMIKRDPPLNEQAKGIAVRWRKRNLGEESATQKQERPNQS